MWNICGHIDIQTTATITQYICGISEGSGLIAVSVVSQGLTGLSSSILQTSLNTIERVSSATSYYLNLYLVYTGTITVNLTSGVNFKATRIA